MLRKLLFPPCAFLLLIFSLVFIYPKRTEAYQFSWPNFESHTLSFFEQFSSFRFRKDNKVGYVIAAENSTPHHATKVAATTPVLSNFHPPNHPTILEGQVLGTSQQAQTSTESLRNEIPSKFEDLLSKQSNSDVDHVSRALAQGLSNVTSAITASIASSVSTNALTVNGDINVAAGSAYKYNDQNILFGQNTTLFSFFGGLAGNATAIVDPGIGSQLVQNTGFGKWALQGLVTGYNNSAFGALALQTNADGFWNSGYGVRALHLNTAGNYNSAFGVEALRRNTTGSENTAVGVTALTANTIGEQNTAVGKEALSSQTEGYYNTAVGHRALYTNSTGSFNTALGMQALHDKTTGDGNVAVGNYAGRSNVTGGSNTIVGYRAAYGVSTNSYSNNSILGARGGEALTTGSNNILIGFQTGNNLTTGSNNIVIGYDIDSPTAINSNTLNIGNIIFGTSITGSGTTIAGSIGIGISAPGQQLTVATSVGFPGIANGAGTAYVCETLATGVLSTSTSACNPSSLRYKDNVLDLSYGLSEAMRLRPVSFDYKPELLVPGHQVGFIAEEVDQIIPEVVGHDAEGRPDNIDYAKLTAILAKAIQELSGRVDAITGTVTGLVLDSISSHVIYTQELHIDGSVCVDDICVTKEQFKDVLINAGGTSNATSTNP